MKKVGLLGGTSYPSTVIYYRRLNELVQEKLGGYHSCPMILYNIDYHPIKSKYDSDWSEIPELLKNELLEILKCNPDSLMICNNTLHKAYHMIREELEIGIPVFDILELTKNYIQNKNYVNVLLLGTKFTMEDGFFQKYISKENLIIEVPDVGDRIIIQEIQSQLALGSFSEEYKSYFKQLLSKYNTYQAVVVACTELPVLFEGIETEMDIINTIELQCQAAIEFSLDD